MFQKIEPVTRDVADIRRWQSSASPGELSKEIVCSVNVLLVYHSEGGGGGQERHLKLIPCSLEKFTSHVTYKCGEVKRLRGLIWSNFPGERNRLTCTSTPTHPTLTTYMQAHTR